MHVFHKCTRVVRGRHALRTRRDTGGALPSDRSVSNNATQPTCTGVSARQRGTAGKRTPSGAASLHQLRAAARRDPREQFTKPARGILVNANGLFSKTPKRFSKRTHMQDLIGSGARSPFSKKTPTVFVNYRRRSGKLSPAPCATVHSPAVSWPPLSALCVRH